MAMNDRRERQTLFNHISFTNLGKEIMLWERSNYFKIHNVVNLTKLR